LQPSQPLPGNSKRILCLSNGHGEDVIAVRVLTALRQQPEATEVAALPLVGEGHAYIQSGIPIIGAVKTLPSGGFIYMDSRQLARDIQGGLLQLIQAQWRAIQTWRQEGSIPFVSPDSQSSDRRSLILAVGDIVPLLFAWSSGLPYAFIGTAKSEYYLRDEAGWLPGDTWKRDVVARWTGCIYYPWERWLMSRPRCKAVFPRDSLTSQMLQQRGVPAFDMGNPMMDGLEWENSPKPLSLLAQSSFSLDASVTLPALSIALLPGSRPPEAYANWEIILQAVNGLIAHLERPMNYLAAIAPGLDLQLLQQLLLDFRWQPLADQTYAVGTGNNRATLTLAVDRFAEFLQRADLAIAMAGTATEQFVGLGKPAITITGKGPQFTPAFAEAQTRLLGCSVILVQQPDQVSQVVQSLLNRPDWLQQIAENGHRRMGEAGSGRRMANHLIQLMG